MLFNDEISSLGIQILMVVIRSILIAGRIGQEDPVLVGDSGC